MPAHYARRQLAGRGGGLPGLGMGPGRVCRRSRLIEGPVQGLSATAFRQHCSHRPPSIATRRRRWFSVPLGHMARCTAPVRGHRSASAAAACPACRGRYYSGYRSYSSPPYYSTPGSDRISRSRSGSSSARPRWSRPGSSVAYTPAEVRALTPIRSSVENRAPLSDPRDVFLCHAWDDRGGAAKELHDLLEERGVSVWFSEKDVVPGTSLLREIDRGLAKSRVGIVLVTPALLHRLRREGIADKELSALLARDLLVPIVHDTTYEDLREVSPLLGSRSGLSTAEERMADVAAKLAELVTL